MATREDYLTRWIKAKHDIDHLMQGPSKANALGWPFEVMAFKALGIIFEMLLTLMREMKIGDPPEED